MRRKRTLIVTLILSVSLFALSLTFGFLFPPRAISEILQQLGEVLQPLESASSVLLVFFIFLNNSIKALGFMILGFFLGIPPIIFICANGFIIGTLIAVLLPEAGPTVVAASLAPHGVIEIPLVLLAASLGISIGWESIKKLIGRNSMVKLQFVHSLKTYLKLILPGLAVAAIVEVFITSWLISGILP
ncbi:stage II sporulation protein M [Chloroflexota bacterium]